MAGKKDKKRAGDEGGEDEDSEVNIAGLDDVWKSSRNKDIVHVRPPSVGPSEPWLEQELELVGT